MTTSWKPGDAETSRTGGEAPALKKRLPAAGPVGSVIVTAAAAEKIREYQTGSREYAGLAFRVRVDGGGCAGFRYTFEFDAAQDDDQRIEAGGAEVVIDPASLSFLRGSTIDYVSTLMNSGFVVTNPNATASCGCGHSFGV